MNEKIKQLAEQARQDYLKNHWPSGISSDSVGMYPQLMEKFAELIVRECADIARVYSEEGVEYNGGDAIREHFGVEL